VLAHSYLDLNHAGVTIWQAAGYSSPGRDWGNQMGQYQSLCILQTLEPNKLAARRSLPGQIQKRLYWTSLSFLLNPGLVQPILIAKLTAKKLKQINWLEISLSIVYYGIQVM